MLYNNRMLLMMRDNAWGGNEVPPDVIYPTVLAVADVLAILSILFVFAGLISPRLVMPRSRKASRIWVLALGVGAVFASAGLGVFAMEGDLTALAFFGSVEAILVALYLRPASATQNAGAGTQLPSSQPIQAGEKTPAPDEMAAGPVSSASTQIAEIRQAVPPDQLGDFDRIYKGRQRTRSVFGQSAVDRMNVESAGYARAEASRLWELKHGALPNISSPLNLLAGEQCVWSAPCSRPDQFSLSDGFSTSSFGIQPRTHRETGDLYLTTKRLIFVGAEETVALKFSEIVSVKTTPKAVEISSTEGKNLHLEGSNLADFDIIWQRVFSGADQ